MPLETGTYISDLVTTNPAHTDGLNNADGHLRLLKSAIKATFPNINAAVTASDEDLNNLSAQLTGGVSILADTGVHFKTNANDGVTNPALRKVDIVGANAGNTASVVIAEFDSSTLQTSLKGAVDVVGNATIHGNETVAGSLTVTGGLSVTGSILGPGTVPIGGMVMWLTDTLPTDGDWCWANGQGLSRSTYATLFGLWSTRYGVGDGSTTFNVIDMQDVVPVGKDTMGGAAGNSLLSNIATGLKQVLGATFGLCQIVLDSTMIPAHHHGVFLTDPGHTHTSNAANFAGASNNNGGGGGVFGVVTAAATINSNTTGISIGSGAGVSNNQTADTGGGLAHNNLQPSRVVNFIIRIA
jgi:microcystin-dependent protein